MIGSTTERFNYGILSKIIIDDTNGLSTVNKKIEACYGVAKKRDLLRRRLVDVLQRRGSTKIFIRLSRNL